MFLVPLLAFIGVFSIWPIARSFYYTFFDYQLNDQQKSGLYLNERFNGDLFIEDCKYLAFYLKDDKTLADASLQPKFDDLINKAQAEEAKYADRTGVTVLSGNEASDLDNFLNDAAAAKQSLYSQANGAAFTHSDDLDSILAELRTVIIPSNFIGLQGYAALIRDARVYETLGHTVVFTVISVFLEFIFGMALALVMNQAVRGIGLIRTTGIIPWAIPTAVSALIWTYMYDGSSGIIAYLLSVIHVIPSPETLLLTGAGAMASAIGADVWKTTPYMALLLLAGLQTIDPSIYESVQIDGAGRVRTFTGITLPLIKSSILVALLFRTLDAFRVFDLIYVLTGGGPGGTTETLSIYAYKLMFAQSNFGYGSVVVLFMFVCVAIIATIFVKVLGTDLMSRG